jgi:hypothetical protein
VAGGVTESAAVIVNESESRQRLLQVAAWTAAYAERAYLAARLARWRVQCPNLAFASLLTSWSGGRVACENRCPFTTVALGAGLIVSSC